MRLIEVCDAGIISFTSDLREQVPPYAILSHTWGEIAEEVTYADIINGVGRQKPGYVKIQFCIDQVRKDGLKYFWIDTCCIDKSNAPELQEAITSMFRWYKKSARCYVFLTDVQTRKRDHQGNMISYEITLRSSRWFTRGWTLQEFLAPEIVQFYSRECTYLGDKNTLAQLLHEITTIPMQAIHGAPLDDFAPKEKFRWASMRRTTRKEDEAYCLQGIFGVYILPNYGEEEYAFKRLKEEICRALPYQTDWNRPSTPINRVDTITAEATHVLQGPSPADRWKTLLASLKFSDTDTRRSTIKPAYSTTCRWLLQTPAWMDWLDAEKLKYHFGFIWMYGKPGAGKSTAMKFAHDQALRIKQKDETVLSFFFNARGDELEKTTLGLYRSLLFQLLSINAAHTILADHAFPADFTDESYPWTLQLLCEILRDVVIFLTTHPCESGHSRRRSIKIFVDALDECSESDIQDMVRFLEDLGNSCVDQDGQFRVCLASRHYPTIDPGPGLQMNLDVESGHENDIRVYIQRHLRSPDRKFKIQDVQEAVQEKANGVFLWVWLVVDILCKEIRNGRIHTIKKRLQEIPPKLSDLFKDIMLRDREGIEEFRFCLQLILFARRPLTREEFYLAMLAGTDSDFKEPDILVSQQHSDEILLRFVQSSSKGLAELTRSKKAPKVQFIHESVRDFLIKEKGLFELWPDLGQDFEAVSHDAIRKACEAYISLIDRDSAQDTTEAIQPSIAKADLQTETNQSFLPYAVQYVLYHADAAAQGVNYHSFLASFNWEKWILLNNLHARHARLLELCNFDMLRPSEQRNLFDYAFCVALAKCNREAALVLLTRRGISNAVASQLRLPISRDHRPSKNMPPIVALCQGGNDEIIIELLTQIQNSIKYPSNDDVLFPPKNFARMNSDAAVAAQIKIARHAMRLGQDDRAERIITIGPLSTRHRPRFLRKLILDTVIEAVKLSKTSILEALLFGWYDAMCTTVDIYRQEVEHQLSTALIEVAQGKMESIVRILLQAHLEHHCGLSIVHLALSTTIRQKQYKALKFLLQNGTFLDTYYYQDLDLLCLSLEVLDLEATHILLDGGGEIAACVTLSLYDFYCSCRIMVVHAQPDFYQSIKL